MNLSTTCPNCGHIADLSCAYWSGLSYQTDCESCGSEIVGFVLQQTINWPSVRPKTHSSRVFPVETAASERQSFSDRAVELTNTAIVWLKAPMSQDLSRLSWWLGSAW